MKTVSWGLPLGVKAATGLRRVVPHIRLCME